MLPRSFHASGRYTLPPAEGESKADGRRRQDRHLHREQYAIMRLSANLGRQHSQLQERQKIESLKAMLKAEEAAKAEAEASRQNALRRRLLRKQQGGTAASSAASFDGKSRGQLEQQQQQEQQRKENDRLIGVFKAMRPWDVKSLDLPMYHMVLELQYVGITIRDLRQRFPHSISAGGSWYGGAAGTTDWCALVMLYIQHCMPPESHWPALWPREWTYAIELVSRAPPFFSRQGWHRGRPECLSNNVSGHGFRLTRNGDQLQPRISWQGQSICSHGYLWGLEQ